MNSIDRRLDHVEEDLLAERDRSARAQGRSWAAAIHERAELRRRFTDRVGWTKAEARALYAFFYSASQLRTDAAWRARHALCEAMNVSWAEQRAMVNAELLELNGDPVPEDVAATVRNVAKRQAAAEAELAPELLDALEAERVREARGDRDGDRVLTPGSGDPTFRRAFAKFVGAVVSAREAKAHEELGAVLLPDEGPGDLPGRWAMLGREELLRQTREGGYEEH